MIFISTTKSINVTITNFGCNFCYDEKETYAIITLCEKIEGGSSYNGTAILYDKTGNLEFIGVFCPRWLCIRSYGYAEL